MTKQSFTIGGSVALKKALLEETGIEPYAFDTVSQTSSIGPANLMPKTQNGNSFLMATAKKLPTHYQLNQDWDKAVAAVKDFFAEEKFEKGKWYYGVQWTSECLLRYRHSVKSGIVCSEVHWVIGPTVSTILNYTYSTAYIESLNLQPATTEQIQFMLGKVAESKGYVKGAKVNCFIYRQLDFMLNGSGAYYDTEKDELWLGNCKVYEKGKWAEIIKEKFEEDKWYYAELDTESKYLLKYQHSVEAGIAWSEVYGVTGTTVATFSYHIYSTAYIEDLNLQPATTEQIQEMLGKVAESKGLIGGNKIKPLYGNPLVISTNKAIYRYDISVDELSLDYQTIYSKGKWAELVSQEETKPETPETLVLEDVVYVDKGRYHKRIKTDLHLTATHIQQLKEYLNK